MAFGNEAVEKYDPYVIGENVSEIFRKVFEFLEIFSFVSFFRTKKNRLRRGDWFGPKIVEIGAILSIFRPFEIFRKQIYSSGLGIT